MESIKGDLIKMALAGKFDVIVHGCNCQCTMGSGIAKQIKKEFEQAWLADRKTMPGDYNKLGNFTTAVIPINGHALTVVNAYTQYNYNSYGQRHDLFEYVAFDLILQKLLHQYGTSHIGIPLIGCGKAGGDANRIIPMIEEFSKFVDERGGKVYLVGL